jgi:hypothetical protein
MDLKVTVNPEMVVVTTSNNDRVGIHTSTPMSQPLVVEKPEPTCHCHQCNEKPVSVVYDEDKNPIGIRIKTLDEDFSLSLKNLGGHDKQYEWKKMMELLKEKGLTTFNYKQAHIIAAYKDEVDKLLEEVDGEPMNDNCFWSVSECDSYYAWFYFGDYGTVFPDGKNNACSVRPLLAH